jgi:hypothetical protein
MIELLTTLRNNLAFLRVQKKKADDLVKTLNDNFKQGIAPMLEHQAIVKEAVNNTEADLRSKLVEHYKADSAKIKKPVEGLSIREETVYKYNEAQAIKWAQDNNRPELLEIKLKKDIFETIAEALKLDFVDITKEPAATIAKELPWEETGTPLIETEEAF